MKRILTVLMTLMMVLLLTACGSSDAANEQTKAAANQTEAAPSPTGKTLVAYFSCTGNTKHLAETAAGALNADIFEIKAKVPYTSADLDWHNENSRTTIEQNDGSLRPEIAEKIANFDNYDKIIIAYPIWWNQAPRIIDTFVESYDFSGKTIIPICTSGGSDIIASENGLRTLSKKAKWLDGKLFSTNASADEIKAWFNDKL